MQHTDSTSFLWDRRNALQNSLPVKKNKRKKYNDQANVALGMDQLGLVFSQFFS
jgi:hypothetical protein